MKYIQFESHEQSIKYRIENSELQRATSKSLSIDKLVMYY